MNHIILKCEKQWSLYILWNPGQIFQFLFPVTINWAYRKLECPSSDSVNDNTEMEFPSSVSIYGMSVLVSVYDKPTIHKQNQ